MAPSSSCSGTNAAASKADNVGDEERAAVVVSPYFASTPQLRKSPRKKATAAVAWMTAAMATTTPSSTAAAWVPPAATFSSSGSRLSPTIARAKRVATSVTPPSSQEDSSSPSSGPTTPNKKVKKSPTSPTDNKKAKKGSPAKKKQAAKDAPMTNSFGPLCSKRYTDNHPVPVHTLILGTHPSVASLSQAEYYGHDMNAFWWIAGDCLGFRRKAGVKKNGDPYGFAQHVRYNNILPYDEQQKTMVLHGFAMWDVIGSCQRPGSLDQDIRNETPNNIQDFANQHKGTLRRIVLANGGTGSTMFVKHFRPWLKSGELQPLAGHEPSEKAFGKATKNHLENNKGDKITLISAVSVSPAAARYSYTEKRDFWEEHVYKPGLADHEENLKSLQTGN